MAFPPFENSDHFVVSVSIGFLSDLNWDVPFHCIAYYYSCADWDSLHDHLRDVPWEDILNSVLLLLLVNVVSGYRMELIYIYIPHQKYKVKPHSSPCFSAACAAALVYRNYFFH